MGISVGSVQVDVVPAALNFARELGAKLLPSARDVGKSMGDILAREIADALGSPKLNEASYARAGERSGAAFSDALSARIREALATLPEIHLDADSTEADLELAAIRRQLEDLANQRIGIDIDETLARAQIDDLRARLAELSDAGDLSVHADTGAAIAKLDEFRAMQERAPVDVPVRANTKGADTDLAAWQKRITESLKVVVKAEADTGSAWNSIKTFTQNVYSRMQWLDTIMVAASKISIGTFGAAGAVNAIGSVGAAGMQLLPILGLIPAAGIAGAAAIGTLKIGLSGVGTALTDAFDPKKAKDFAAALAKLPPPARDFVTTIKGMAPALTALRLDVQTRLFTGMAETVRTLGANYLPIARAGFASMAGSLNDAVRGSVGLLNLRYVVDGMRVATDNVTAAWHGMLTGLKPVTAALITLVTVGSTELPGIGNTIGSLATSFNEFIQGAARTQQLATWFHDAVTAAGQLFQIAGNLAVILGNIFGVAQASGANFLGILLQVTSQIRQFVSSAQGANVIEGVFNGIRQALALAYPTLNALGNALVTYILPAVMTMLPVIGNAIGTLAPAIQPLAQIIANLAPLVAYLAQAFANQLAVGVRLVAPLLIDLSRVLGSNPQLVYAITSAIGPLVIAFGVLSRVIHALSVPLTLFKLAMLATGKSATELTGPLAKIGSVTDVFKTAAGKVLEFIKPLNLLSTLGKLIGGVVTNLAKAFVGMLGPVSILITIFTILFTTNADFRNAIMGLIGTIGNLVNTLVSDLQPVLSIFAGQGVSLGQIFGDFATGLATVLVPIIHGITAAINFLMPVIAPLVGIFLAIRGAVMLWSLAQTLLDIALSANPIGALILGIALLIGGVVAAYQHFDWFRNAVNAVWQAIVTAATWIGGAAVAAFHGFMTAVQAVGNAFAVAWNAIGTAASWLWNTILSPVLSAIGLGLRIAGAIIFTVLVAPFVIAFNILSAIITAWWTYVVSPVLHAVGAIFVWLYQNVIVPIFAAIVVAVMAAVGVLTAIWNGLVTAVQWLGAAFVWFYGAVIVPIWNGIRAFIEMEVQGVVNIWNGYLMPAIRFIGSVFSWLYTNVILPVWNGIRAFIEMEVQGVVNIWNGYLMPAIRFVGSIFQWLYTNIIQPVWSGISSAISGAWNFIKGIFNYLTTGTSGVGAVFSSVADWIGRTWASIVDATRKPAQFVVDVVYNNGVLPVWNGIAGLFALPKLNPVHLATGGVLGGFAPGVDRIPAMLSPGEGVLVPEAVQALGPGFVGWANSTFSGGRSDGGEGTGYSRGGIAHFADGGIVGGVEDFLSGAVDFIGKAFTDPVGAVKDIFSKVLGDGANTPGAGSYTDALKQVPIKTVDAVITKVKDWVSTFASGGAGSGAVGQWIAEALAITGTPGNWAGPLNTLIMRESGGNPRAINLWDSNAKAGHPSQGLMQTIPSTFESNRDPRLPDDIYNPLSNIVAGINYIKRTYGSVFNVQQAVGSSPKGYDLGGVASGVGVLPKYTVQPERVLSPQQTQSFDRLVSNLDTGRTATDSGTAGAFTGTLVLDSGELMGVVQGQISSAHGDAARQLTYGRS